MLIDEKRNSKKMGNAFLPSQKTLHSILHLSDKIKRKPNKHVRTCGEFYVTSPVSKLLGGLFCSWFIFIPLHKITALVSRPCPTRQRKEYFSALVDISSLSGYASCMTWLLKAQRPNVYHTALGFAPANTSPLSEISKNIIFSQLRFVSLFHPA